MNNKSKTPINECDVLVIGGGASGIAAAVSAAKSGSKVILIERYGFLGGMATSAWVGTICGAYYLTSKSELKFTNEGFAKTFIEELRVNNGLGEIAYYKDAVYVPYSPVMFKIVCDSFISSEPNITLLLHSQAVKVKIKDKRIYSVVIYTKSGMQEIFGKIFLDCTGDADIAFMSGVPMQKSTKLQYPSTMFIVNHVDQEKAKTAGTNKLIKIMLHAKMFGNIKISRLSGSLFFTGRPGEVIVSMTRVTNKNNESLDFTRVEDLTYGELVGRQQVITCFELLKKKMPGFEDAYLSDIAPQLGIRESRRIKGHYLLNSEDVLEGRTFSDGIGWGAWPIELHTEGGKTDWFTLKNNKRYQIPYRCLCPQNIENLLVAGRCVSATHEAMGSLRVIGTCFALGQSAGVIASKLAFNKQSNNDISGKDIKNIDIEEY